MPGKPFASAEASAGLTGKPFASAEASAGLTGKPFASAEPSAGLTGKPFASAEASAGPTGKPFASAEPSPYFPIHSVLMTLAGFWLAALQICPKAERRAVAITPMKMQRYNSHEMRTWYA